MFSICEDSSAGLLVEFHQHATGHHVVDHSVRHPNAVADCTANVSGNLARAAMPKPPVAKLGTVATSPGVVVAVRSTEHHAVGSIGWGLCRRQRIAGVSAVPCHRQSVLTNLIADGERRVFSRVPQTSITLDLLTAILHSEITVPLL